MLLGLLVGNFNGKYEHSIEMAHLPWNQPVSHSLYMQVHVSYLPLQNSYNTQLQAPTSQSQSNPGITTQWFLYSSKFLWYNIFVYFMINPVFTKISFTIAFMGIAFSHVPSPAIYHKN